jgi:hypothetical protein
MPKKFNLIAPSSFHFLAILHRAFLKLLAEQAIEIRQIFKTRLITNVENGQVGFFQQNGNSRSNAFR